MHKQFLRHRVASQTLQEEFSDAENNKHIELQHTRNSKYQTILYG